MSDTGMDSSTCGIYRHSGHFPFHGPLVALGAALVTAFVGGYIYSYLLRWCPFIYVNFLATCGLGLLIGFVTLLALKGSHVRNSALVLLCALAGGAMGLYFAWSAHLHAVFSEEPLPLICSPFHILAGLLFLYEHGSWALKHGDNVTGIPLAIMWLLEAGVIVGAATVIPVGTLSDTPYCEDTKCWLDEEKVINNLEAFTDPEQIAALKSGDLSPLLEANPRNGAMYFGRLRIKHSPRCKRFLTVRIENVAITYDKENKPQEKVERLTDNIRMPAEAYAQMIQRFEPRPGAPAT